MMTKISLISLSFLFLVAGFALAECPLSGDIDNFVVVAEGDLEVMFGSAGAVFALDDTVRFELVVTNKGSEPVQINFPVHYPEAVFVTDAACPDVVSCLYEYAFVYPPALLYFPGSIDLAPGECQKWTMEWDLASDPTPVGPYKAWGGLFAWTDGVDNLPLGAWILPAEGATILIDLVETVAADRVSWGEAKSAYR